MDKQNFTLEFLCKELTVNPEQALFALSLGTYTFQNADTIAYCCILPFDEALEAPGPQWPKDLTLQSSCAWFHLIAANKPVNLRKLIAYTLTDGRFKFPLTVYARPVNLRMRKFVARYYNAKPHKAYPHIWQAVIENPESLLSSRKIALPD